MAGKQVGIVVGPQGDSEAMAIRSSLERFGYTVILFFIGRPNDLIEILSNQEGGMNIKYLIFCFHGSNGKLVMPKLAKNIYSDDEPKSDFGIKEIAKYSNFSDSVIINNACSLGKPRIASSFLRKGASIYIGAVNDIEADAVVIFTINFFYFLKQKNTVYDAFIKAQQMDAEMENFKIYVRPD